MPSLRFLPSNDGLDAGCQLCVCVGVKASTAQLLLGLNISASALSAEASDARSSSVQLSNQRRTAVKYPADAAASRIFGWRTPFLGTSFSNPNLQAKIMMIYPLSFTLCKLKQ